MNRRTTTCSSFVFFSTDLLLFSNLNTILLGLEMLYNSMGTNNYVTVGINNLPVGSSPRTIEVWVNTVFNGLGNVFSYGACSSGNVFQVGTWGGNIFISSWSSPQFLIPAPVNDGNWHNIVQSYGGALSKVYFDGGDLIQVRMQYRPVLEMRKLVQEYVQLNCLKEKSMNCECGIVF